MDLILKQWTHATRNVYSHLSGLEDVVFNDFIKDDFIPEGRGQVASAVRFCIPS
jgi:hypothetical protein